MSVQILNQKNYDTIYISESAGCGASVFTGSGNIIILTSHFYVESTKRGDKWEKDLLIANESFLATAQAGNIQEAKEMYSL